MLARRRVVARLSVASRGSCFDASRWVNASHQRRLLSQPFRNLSLVLSLTGSSCFGKGESGDGPRPDQGLPDRVAHEVVYEAGVAKAHFDLRGVDVHVHFGGGQFKKDERHRKDASGKDIAIRLRDGVQHQPVAHQPAVHEEVDVVAVQLLHFRARGES